jgi:peroxiredoxin
VIPASDNPQRCFRTRVRQAILKQCIVTVPSDQKTLDDKDLSDNKEIDMTLLHPGETFPNLALTPTDGTALELPDALAGHFGVVLFYRGAWCPYCNAQLRAFQRAADNLAEVDARVVALSVDDEATTAELVAKHGLTFPVGHSADARAVAEATGAFVNPEPTFLQSTGFVLDPTGKVVVSVYSSGAIGRLVPEDVIGMIRYIRGQAPANSA